MLPAANHSRVKFLGTCSPSCEVVELESTSDDLLTIDRDRSWPACMRSGATCQPHDLSLAHETSHFMLMLH